MDSYSTNIISKDLLNEIVLAIKNVSPFGSVEIYIQNSEVTQITTRNIKKTNKSSGGYQSGHGRKN